MTHRKSAGTAAVTVMAVSVLLGACGDDQNNATGSGNYGGIKDTPLNEQQLRDIRARTALQAGLAANLGRSGKPPRAADVRPPGR